MKSHQAFLTLFTILTIISAILAFSTAGAPWKAREEKIDNQHVQNISRIANDLYSEFTQANQPLPMTIESKNYYVNPETNLPDTYNYRRLSELSFELCADFKTNTSNRPPYMQYAGSTNIDFRHNEGYQCFKFNYSYPDNSKMIPVSQPLNR